MCVCVRVCVRALKGHTWCKKVSLTLSSLLVSFIFFRNVCVNPVASCDFRLQRIHKKALKHVFKVVLWDHDVKAMCSINRRTVIL